MTDFVKPVDMVMTKFLPEAWISVLLTPPALTRLEPRSISGDPSAGAEARIADPLWMLGRQWQLGELLGEDVGSPVSVTVSRRALPITVWVPTGRTDGTDRATDPQWRPWPEGAVLDELVEQEPVRTGLRWSAETGQQLDETLRDAGHDDAADLLLASTPLVLPDDPTDPDGAFDPGAARLFAALTGRVPDGATAAAALAAGDPEWIADAGDPDGARMVATEWLAWVRGAPDAGGAWTTTRLEHRFELRFGHGADAAVLRAVEFGSGSARWHHFEWRDRAKVELPGDELREAPAVVTDVMLASPLRYPGMPADRYWQLEEGAIDVSAIEAQPHDLARLCLAEFALVSGDDWLLVPVDGSDAALNQILSVTVTNTFGEQLAIADGAAERKQRGFRMYEVVTSGDRTLPGLVFPPAGSTPMTGEPVEEVAFARDETANLGFAIERIVPGRSGDPRFRSSEPQPARPTVPANLDPRDVLYELQVPVPRHWIPLVPVRLGPGVVGLRKGAFLDDDVPVVPAGNLLAPTPLTFPNEEIPREGIVVRTVPALARRRNGSYARWIGHRIRTGRGEGSSRYASDNALPARRPLA